MFTLSSDVLSLTGEPAALLQNRRLVFVNDAAAALLGADCIGKGIRDLFGDEIAACQAPHFAATASVRGQTQLLRFSRIGSMQVVFFSRAEQDSAIFNDAWLQALRSGLMNINLAVNSGRSIAESLAHEGLKHCFGALTREYYLMNRLLANIDAARAVLSGELTPSLGVTDPGAQLSDLVDSLHLLRPDVELAISSDRDTLIWADASLLELMLMNLLSNCLTHAGAQHVRIELRHGADRLYLSVRDDGCGIAPEKLSGIFHRYRTALPLHELSLGAGLGMTVIRGIAEAHGGALMLESREGIGTTVRVSFSRQLGAEAGLRERYVPYLSSMDSLLIGLAPCLPADCFDGKYLD